MTAPSSTAIVCYDWDGPWARLQGPAIVAGIIYVIGVPFGVLCTLWVGYQLSEGRGTALLACAGGAAMRATDAATGRRRVLSRGMLEPTWREAFGPLYTSYHHTSCLWEVVMMVRKVGRVLSHPPLPNARARPTRLFSGPCPRLCPCPCPCPCHMIREPFDPGQPSPPPTSRAPPPPASRPAAGEPRARARILRDGAGGAGVARVHHPHRLPRHAARLAPIRPQARERNRERLPL